MGGAAETLAGVREGVSSAVRAVRLEASVGEPFPAAPAGAAYVEVSAAVWRRAVTSAGRALGAGAVGRLSPDRCLPMAAGVWEAIRAAAIAGEAMAAVAAQDRVEAVRVAGAVRTGCRLPARLGGREYGRA